MELLKVVLVILLIYFGIKIIFRFFGPAIKRFVLKKIGEKIEKQFRKNHGFPETQKHKKGETYIHKKNRKKKKPEHETGEYIDFEEID